MIKKNKRIRVLVADDSFFMRKLLRDLLNSDPMIEVIGEAKNGIEAIVESSRLEPDIIIMDYNMPEMNGAQATREILSKKEPLPVILMFSAYTTEGAEKTLECLRAGAVDFIEKPSGELSLDVDKVKDEILEKVKILAKVSVKRFEGLKITKPEKSALIPGRKALKIVVIGSSTGGPPVLENILSKLPGNLDAAIMVAQHMPKHFTETFAKRLDKICRLRVKEAQGGELLEVGRILVAQGGSNIKIEKGKRGGKSPELFTELNDDHAKNGLFPSIDILMISAARHCSAGIVGVILTGMGQDGLEGMRAIKSIGGYTIVQDPKTAVVGSMPQAVIEESLADEILPPDKIVKRIVDLVGLYKP